jgi:hypothetical protein
MMGITEGDNSYANPQDYAENKAIRVSGYDVTAVCDNHACSNTEFSLHRKEVVKVSTTGNPYTIEKVVCPKCRMWAAIKSIDPTA